METPAHYHVWTAGLGGRGLMMMAAKLPATEIKRQRLRGSRRTVRRWWRTRQAARRAMEAAGRRGHVLQCDLGEACPERAHVLSN